ncbi:hypothetical protein Vafri_17324, partial [Volvox africanus]
GGRPASSAASACRAIGPSTQAAGRNTVRPSSREGLPCSVAAMRSEAKLRLPGSRRTRLSPSTTAFIGWGWTSRVRTDGLWVELLKARVESCQEHGLSTNNGIIMTA